MIDHWANACETMQETEERLAQFGDQPMTLHCWEQAAPWWVDGVDYQIPGTGKRVYVEERVQRYNKNFGILFSFRLIPFFPSAPAPLPPQSSR